MIHVWYKEPGKIGRDRWIKNELHVFQELVGGYIEVVRLRKSPDYCLIVNEEGLLNSMPLNLVVGENFLFGPIIVVGLLHGEDVEEFTSCNLKADQVRRMLLKEG